LPGSVITFDPDRLRRRIAELEKELGAPGFWDDQQRAARVSAEHARLTRRLERYERLTRDYDDARELFAMDGDMADEIAASIVPLRRELERLQEDALFTGEYDGGDAVVTIHAGTGGTDAQLDESELRIDTYRASGAGGQHVNKTDSAVRITHIPTGIVVQCQNERSQAANKQTALRILKSRLAELEQERREQELARERGSAQQADFGSQIRSYVLHPYQLVKDHRTEHETGNTQAVLDGALDDFIHEYLLAKAAGRVL
jgi:protein subunit release factor A